MSIPPAPVTLATNFFKDRPEIPESDRERLGADFKAPVPVSREKRRQSEDEILKEAEAAARDLKGFVPMPRWIKIGMGLVILRRRAIEESGAKGAMGVAYSVKFGALVRQHGFGWITRTTRWAAICIVENLKEVERRLAKLDDTKRIAMGLNCPQVIWNFVLSERSKERGIKPKHSERPMMHDAEFAQLVDTIADGLVSGNVVEMALNVCECLGFRVPKAAIKRAQRREGIVQPRYHLPQQQSLPWSPFALSM
jgi:hypothetical protein